MRRSKKGSKKANNCRIEVKESSAYIVSFNCNGAKHFHKVKAYCKENKSAISWFQEIKTGSKKKL